jgi:predicted DNA-binding transcriptional regulator
VISIELNLRNAISIRHVLFKEQERYTYNPTCVPERINDIRETIAELDKQIEDQLKEESND